MPIVVNVFSVLNALSIRTNTSPLRFILEEIKKFGEKAKKRVAKEYTWEKICNEYEKVFTDWEN